MANDGKKETKNNKHFLKDFKAELKKVIWPTPKQVVNNTVAVITIVLITCVIVLVLDLAFEGMNKYGINKLKNMVNSSTVNEIADNSINNDIDLENDNTVDEENTL